MCWKVIHCKGIYLVNMISALPTTCPILKTTGRWNGDRWVHSSFRPSNPGDRQPSFLTWAHRHRHRHPIIQIKFISLSSLPSFPSHPLSIHSMVLLLCNLPQFQVPGFWFWHGFPSSPIGMAAGTAAYPIPAHAH